MNEEIAQPVPAADEPLRWLDRLGRRIVLRRLESLQYGRIVLCDGEHRQSFGRSEGGDQLLVRLEVLDPRFYGEVAFGGTIGAGEAYIRDYWKCDDLTGLVRILLQNRELLEQVGGGLARLTRPLQKLLHWLNRNTRKGSRRNISAHYDLGNDFYRLWLDQRMMYSCAYFDDPDMPLEDAATSKLDRICRKLELQPDDHVIEIGSGWGGFAIFAAKHYGCHVTTTTISAEQHEFARKAIADAGLEERITLLKKDYRDLDGNYDKLVSIEMIEAVGHDFHETFFRKCCSLLKPNGLMLLQAITIADQRYSVYRRGVDFIQRYIFPGGCLTSVTDMARVLTTATDLRTIHLEDIGPHYAKTLRHWRKRFMAELDRVRDLGYSESFIRMWDYYLSYCEGAFTERATGTVQMLLMRPSARSSSRYAPTAAL